MNSLGGGGHNRSLQCFHTYRFPELVEVVEAVDELVRLRSQRRNDRIELHGDLDDVLVLGDDLVQRLDGDVALFYLVACRLARFRFDVLERKKIIDL